MQLSNEENKQSNKKKGNFVTFLCRYLTNKTSNYSKLIMYTILNSDGGRVVVKVTCSEGYLKKVNFRFFLIKVGDISMLSRSNLIIFVTAFSRFARLCLPIPMRLISRNNLLLYTTECDRISWNRVKDQH